MGNERDWRHRKRPSPTRQCALTMPPTPKNIAHLKDRLSLSPEEASALTGIGLTSIKTATYSGALVARKHGKNTVILPDDRRTVEGVADDGQKYDKRKSLSQAGWSRSG